MKELYKNNIKDKILLVWGDDDYIKLVDFLIKENKFEKLLFPDHKQASSLYKKIDLKYRANLDDVGVKNKIQVKEKGSLGI